MSTPLADVTPPHPSNPLHQLHDQGQSVWYDNITRAMVTDGGLQSLIDDYGVLGLTSNPTIFAAAIAGSDLYDLDIQHGIRTEQHAEQIFQHLAVSDIRAAADVLRPIYDRTSAYDGYVSLEVSPAVADDTDGTVQEARQLWQALDRPNVMIKVPATRAGIPAITTLISAGINVNVTLIFAIARYREVIDAYLAGLDQRIAAGQPLETVASVASFFVSRVDTAVNTQLDEKATAAPPASAEQLQRLRGKAAIANAKLAYQLFASIFYGDGFARYQAHQAQRQRPLWASTSTKNPADRDTMYVEALIGKDTIDTMPPATLRAFADHGQVHPTITEGVADAPTVFRALHAAGIDIDQVTTQLEHEGVQSFSRSYQELLATIAGKCHQIEATA